MEGERWGGPVCRLNKIQGSFRFCRRGRRPRRPAEGPLRLQSPPSSASHALGTFPLIGGRLAGGRKGRPYGWKRTGRVGSANPGAGMEPHQRQFLQTQGPVARRELRPATQILRAGSFLPDQRGNPRKWGPGKGEYEHEVLIWSRPRGRFAYFAAMGKVGRRPQAAKSPCKKRNRSIHCPLIRPSVRTGAPSPQGEGLRAADSRPYEINANIRRDPDLPALPAFYLE